jgi:hypothetical protein
VVEQLPEKIELLRRQLDLLVADMGLTAAGVDAEIAVLDLRRFGCAPSRRRPPQYRLHPGNELARVERLRHVIVGADLEPDDLVDVLVACRQHQDRDVLALPDPPADVDAVHVGKHQVEHDQRRLFQLDLCERVSSRADGLDPVPGVLQVERDERSDRGLILDDQHGLGL